MEDGRWSLEFVASLSAPCLSRKARDGFQVRMYLFLVRAELLLDVSAEDAGRGMLAARCSLRIARCSCRTTRGPLTGSTA